jgi:hypothetical protein
MLHKFGLESHRVDLAESVCVPENTRAGSPVRDCSGFAIANYVRFVFAKCQAPCFCFYRGRIGNRASEVPLRDALHDRLEQPWWHDSQGGNPRVISEQSGG